MNTQETKDTLEKFRAWIIRFNRDLKDPDLVRNYMDENPCMTAVEFLAEKYNYTAWMRNRDEISPSTADEWRTKFLKEAKEIERNQHGNTWDAAIKAHDDRGHVFSRSTCDFDEYVIS